MDIKRIIACFSACFSAVLLCCVCAGAVSAEDGYYDPVTRQEFTLPDNVSGSGIKNIGGRLYKCGAQSIEPFTGFAKSGGGTKYYINGSQWFGWKKISGKWYYFDGASKGLMAVSKAETKLGTYCFNSDGTWNGKYSKKAKVPADFEFTFEERYYGGELVFDSARGLLINGEGGYDALPEGYFERKIKVPAADRQIIYDCLISCRGDKLKKELTSGSAAGTDICRYKITFTANGEQYEVNGDASMYSLYASSRDVRHAAYLIAFMKDYIAAYPEFTDTERAKAKAAAGVPSSGTNDAPPSEVPSEDAGSLDPDVTVRTGIDNVSVKLYKYTEWTSGAGGDSEHNALIMDSDEAERYCGAVLSESYGKNCGAVKKIMSCGDEYFGEHVLLVYSDLVGSGSCKYKFMGAERRSGSENAVVIKMKKTLPETYTDDMACFVMIAEIPSADISGADSVYFEFV